VAKFAGFESLGDYLEQRCRERGVSFQALSEEIKSGHGYIHAIATGRFSPAPKRLDAIADFFGDNRRILRILVGIELPPTENDKILTEVQEVAVGLSLKNRRELLRYAQYLRTQETSAARSRADSPLSWTRANPPSRPW